MTHTKGVQAPRVVAYRLSCPGYMESSQTKGSNPSPLHGQAESYPLYHQGSPTAPSLTDPSSKTRYYLYALHTDFPMLLTDKFFLKE